MVEFAWFYVFKFLLVLSFLYLIIRPVYKEYKETGKVTPQGKKVSIFLAFVLGVLLVFNPVKIDSSTGSDRLRQSYDSPSQLTEEIERHGLSQYSPGDNSEEIKRILEK